MDTVEAPFTADQAASIRGYQQSGVLRPFACARDDCPAHTWRGRSWLLCDEDGLFCPAPGCGYRQAWALAFMADWAWQGMRRAGRDRRRVRRLMRGAWGKARRVQAPY